MNNIIKDKSSYYELVKPEYTYCFVLEVTHSNQICGYCLHQNFIPHSSIQVVQLKYKTMFLKPKY
ncbi:UNVERIFIED_CONTAM: hypothetical protein NCL1_24349 [Trichonephila clavipes]